VRDDPANLRPLRTSAPAPAERSIHCLAVARMRSTTSSTASTTTTSAPTRRKSATTRRRRSSRNVRPRS